MHYNHNPCRLFTGTKFTFGIIMQSTSACSCFAIMFPHPCCHVLAWSCSPPRDHAFVMPLSSYVSYHPHLTRKNLLHHNGKRAYSCWGLPHDHAKIVVHHSCHANGRKYYASWYNTWVLWCRFEICARKGLSWLVCTYFSYTFLLKSHFGRGSEVQSSKKIFASKSTTMAR